MTTIETVPPLTRSEEAGFVRDVPAWLAAQTMPADAIVWCPKWKGTIAVDNVSYLRTLVSDLPTGEYAGLKRHGSSGPWAQVRAIENRGDQLSSWPFELHPHDWALGIPEAVWKLIGHDIGDVVVDLWNWVTTCTPPAEHPEPTTRPKPSPGFW